MKQLSIFMDIFLSMTTISIITNPDVCVIKEQNLAFISTWIFGFWP